MPRRGPRHPGRTAAERTAEIGDRSRSWDEQVLVGRDRRQARAAEQVARRLVSEVLGR